MKITPAVVARINALARKAREASLTPEEAGEQRALRAAYAAAFRRNLEATLDHTVIVDAHGRRTPVIKRDSDPKKS